MKSNIKSLFIPILIGFMLIGCGGADNNETNVKKVRNQFKEIIEDFDSQKENVADEFQEGKQVLLTFKEAIQKAKDKDKAFAKVHNKWQEIEDEVRQLRNKFKELTETADQFYATLETKSETIHDVELKNKSLSDLNHSKEKYIKRLKATKGKINDLDKINIKVRDTITALEINYSISILEQELDKTFAEIDQMIISVMNELEKLSEESKDLLSSRFGE